jgi:hypothetical protein
MYTTSQGETSTPSGPKPGDIWEPLVILGISPYVTQTGNLPNDNFELFELKTISVPPGTLAIIPVPNAWNLAHGTLSPETFDPLDENASQTWFSADRPWGLGFIDVRVIEVYEPDYSVNPPIQQAQLKIEMHLCDYNADDKWFGTVEYTLIFLGQATTGSGGTGTPPPPPPSTSTPGGRSRNIRINRGRRGRS